MVKSLERIEGLFHTVRIPAKINLWLEVIGKREDGYHELSSLMLPIGIFDEVKVELNQGDRITLDCDKEEVPVDETNLAWKAASAYLQECRWECGLHISIKKQIPIAAGLGGGSADAAAVLLAMNHLRSNRMSMDRLVDIATGLGADVPFFLNHIPAHALGVGEKLSPVRGVPDYPLVLIKPPLNVSTGWVYRSLKLTRGECGIKLRTFLASPWRLAEIMENDLESVTLTAFPEIGKIKEWLLRHGAAGALMSGSGPTVYGIFPNKEQARETGLAAQEVWNDCWVAVSEVQGNLNV